MKESSQSVYAYRVSARILKHQLEHVKAQANPSDYLRMLIERDFVVCHAES
jgi:hypothetical protein